MENPYQGPASQNELTAPKFSFGWLFVKLVVFSAVCVVIIALLFPVNRGRTAARRTQCKNHLKQIGLALHNYHDMYGTFPPAVLTDNSGRPLHSWRTLILPFLEQENLYRSIDLTKPWDDPANQKARDTNVPRFRCPSTPTTVPMGCTSYLALVGDHQPLHPFKSRNFDELTDGTFDTLLVVEVPPDQAVHWMAPNDLDIDTLMKTATTVHQNHTGGFQAVLCDGSVRFISSNIDPLTLKALSTIDANDVVGEF